MSKSDDIEEMAASWLGRRDRGLGQADLTALELWLSASTANRVAFLRLEAVWQRTDRLSVLKKPLLIKDRAGSRDSRKQHYRRLAVAALLMMSLLSAALMRAYWPPRNNYVTAIGQHDAFKLADGTRVELNTNTAMLASVTGTTRTVTLERGEAYFEVVHDVKRPFVVLAGNRRITDLGTKFSVFRDGDHVQVVVKEGHVRIDVLTAPAAGDAVVAGGGNIVIARADETLVAKKTSSEIADELDWRRDMLFFNQETLADAAAEFNRYNTTHIVVEGAAQNIRIGGSFKADNLEVFAALVHEGFGLNVRRRGNEIVISEQQ